MVANGTSRPFEPMPETIAIGPTTDKGLRWGWMARSRLTRSGRGACSAAVEAYDIRKAFLPWRDCVDLRRIGHRREPSGAT